MNKKTIAVVTGTRSEYGLLRSSMTAISDSPTLDLVTVATGMHLSPHYGSTLSEIEADGFSVDRMVDMLIDGDSGVSMAKSLGIGISGLAEAFREVAPDLVLVLGDRGEALAAGIAAAHMNVPIAHIHGGDSMEGATIDDSIRHALTKFAHLHFPATDASAERIERMGEEPWRITVVGAPGLDDVLGGNYSSPEAVRNQLELSSRQPIVLVVQHPITTRAEEAERQMRTTLNAVSNVDAQVLIIYPNADAGGARMIEAIESHPNRTGFTVVRNLSRSTFLGLLNLTDVMVGNSSSGIIEAPSFGVPVVNIGPRQESRERADNLIDVPHDETAISDGVRRCLESDSLRRRAKTCDNPYDQGGAAKMIVERLKEIELTDSLIRKRLTY